MSDEQAVPLQGPVPVSVPLLRWLHLTDLHVGKNDESQETALASLIDAIARECGDTVFDLVMLTGDLAYSGSLLEYERLETLVINPLRSLKNFRDAKFVATPGNHDLDCDVGYPVNWANIGPKRQTTFFNLDELGRKTRAPRAAAFSSYSKFLQNNAIPALTPPWSPPGFSALRCAAMKLAY